MSAFLFFQVSDVGSEKLFSPTTPKGKTPLCFLHSPFQSLPHSNNNWVSLPKSPPSNPAASIQI